MASFNELLISGQLDLLPWGASLQEAKNLLGPPQDTSVSKKPWIWKYGSLELAFFRNEGAATLDLESLSLSFRKPVVVPSALNWPALPEDGFIREQIENLLKSADVKWTVDDLDHLILPSGAHLTFDEDRLDSVHCIAPSLPDAPALRTPRQLALSLPLNVYERLKQEARKRAKSPAALGAEWIAASVANLPS